MSLEGPSIAPPPPELRHLHFGDPLLDRLDAHAARQARHTIPPAPPG